MGRKKRNRVLPVFKQLNDPTEFLILCGDFSLNRPGLAIIHYDVKTCAITCRFHEVLEFPNRYTTGQKLWHFGEWLKHIITGYKPHVLVRERMFSRFPNETQALAKVIGQSDVAAYAVAGVFNTNETKSQKLPDEFIEIPPVSIKKLVTGDGRATKEDVANVVKEYVGNIEFKFDDETDAIAAGIAWLVKNEYPIKKIVDLDIEGIKHSQGE